MSAATVEFADAGYQAASLTAIVDRSGVTKGALYFHFTSKKDLAVAVVDEMEQACRRLTDRVYAGDVDPLRRLTLLAQLLLETLDQGPVLYAGRRLCAAGIGGPERVGMPWVHWQRVVDDLLGRAGEVGLLRDRVDPVSAGRLVTDMSVGAFTTSLATAALGTLPERTRAHWEVVLGAVATDAWLARWRAEGGMAAVLGLEPPPAPGGG